MHTIRALVVPILAAGIVLGAVGCSVVGDRATEPIDPPFGLDDTRATTTSTTTTIAETTTTGLETTTTPAVQSEQVRLYFITSGQLTYVTAQLPSPVALPQIVAALQVGPPEGELGTGLRTAVPPLPAEIRVTTDGSGVAQVELPTDFFLDMPVGDQRLVIAQIVLTLTDSRGIGQVVFDQAVPKPSGELTPAGQPLAFRDYQSLLGSVPGGVGPASATTTVTTAATTTSSSSLAP